MLENLPKYHPIGSHYNRGPRKSEDVSTILPIFICFIVINVIMNASFRFGLEPITLPRQANFIVFFLQIDLFIILLIMYDNHVQYVPCK